MARLSPRTKSALGSARVLDDVVASQLALVSQLPEAARHRAADFLTELVMLAQAYRHYAAGWIDRRELERRGLLTTRRLALIRQRQPQFTERN